MQDPHLYMKIGNGDEFDIADKIPGVHYLGDDATPVNTNQFNQIAGVDGASFVYKTINNYQVPAKFYFIFQDYQDYKLIKHQINRLFATRELIRIRTDTEKFIVRFVVANLPTIAPMEEAYSHWATFTENFDNPSGYRYSLYRSDADNIAEKSQFEMGIPSGKKLSYHFTTPEFDVFNAGDITVDPYFEKHDLQIKIKFNGSSLKLENTNNGSIYTYTNPATSNDTIILDGITTTLNGQPASNNTDYGNLTLEPGWNHIKATGASNLDITFSFPFVYI